MILQVAVKCRYCGEFLDQSYRPEALSPPPARLTVSDGVRVGVGMFIKLPLILLGILVGVFLLMLVLSWVSPSNEPIRTPTAPTQTRRITRCPKGKVLVKTPGINPFCTTAENAQILKDIEGR